MKHMTDGTTGSFIHDVAALAKDTVFEVWCEGRRFGGKAELVIERGIVALHYPSKAAMDAPGVAANEELLARSLAVDPVNPFVATARARAPGTSR